MFPLVKERHYLKFSCFAHGVLYCHEDGDYQINMDWLIKFQYPDRDALKEKHAHPPTHTQKAAVFGFVALSLSFQTAALHSKDTKYVP